MSEGEIYEDCQRLLRLLTLKEKTSTDSFHRNSYCNCCVDIQFVFLIAQLRFAVAELRSLIYQSNFLFYLYFPSYFCNSFLIK